MSRPKRPFSSLARRLLPALAACLLLAGCITTPLANRDWLALRTAHYDIWSSLGEQETARLAVELERFRAAAEFIWGRAIPAAPVRTRVYAFDDRSIGRPFAVRSQRSYLLPRQSGDVIVLRTGDGWGGDARTQLKLEYARRLFWNTSPAELPPWLEEGLAQVASTLEIRGAGATVGILRRDHVRDLREGQWVPFERLLAASDLIGWSSLERARFEAESWALCHYLALSEQRRGRSSAAFARFRSSLAGGIAPAEAARSVFGEEQELQQAVWHHVRAGELDSLTVRIPWTGPRPVARAVAKREILEELATLSLAIGEFEQAERLLEDALALDAGSARALAGLGDAREARGDYDAADAHYRAALAAAPDDPIVQLGWANLLRSRAATTRDPGLRAQLASRAREHYQRSTELDPQLPEPHAGLAASYLLEGEDPAAGRAAARTARTLLPGDSEIRRVDARLALAVGDRATARREAIRLLTRARTMPDLEAARALLAQIDSRTAAR